MDRNEAVARILAHAAASQSGSDGATWTRDELHDRSGLAQVLAHVPEGLELAAIEDAPSEPEEIF